MARGTQFSELVSMLKAECGRSTTVGVGVDDTPYLKQRLNASYESLWREYDWPHLRFTADRISLAAGSRYYDFPDDMDIENVEQVAVWWNDIPLPVERGVDFTNYSTFSSEDDERSDPVTHWDTHRDGDTTQFEVWPMPASNAQSIQFIGYKKFERLVDDADVCHLDDMLVVLFAATPIVRRQSSKDADAIQGQAQALLNRLRARTGPGKRVRMGLGSAGDRYPHRAVVRIGS